MLKAEDIKEPFSAGEIKREGVSIVVPYIEVMGEIDGVKERLTLHWGNTTVRLFYFQTELNHAEYRHEGRLMGLRLDQDMLDGMMEHCYPVQSDPILDDETIAWVSSIETRSLESELGEL